MIIWARIEATNLLLFDLSNRFRKMMCSGVSKIFGVQRSMSFCAWGAEQRMDTYRRGRRLSELCNRDPTG